MNRVLERVRKGGAHEDAGDCSLPRGTKPAEALRQPSIKHGRHCTEYPLDEHRAESGIPARAKIRYEKDSAPDHGARKRGFPVPKSCQRGDGVRTRHPEATEYRNNVLFTCHWSECIDKSFKTSWI